VIINQVKQKLHLVGYLLIRYFKDARYHEHKRLRVSWGNEDILQYNAVFHTGHPVLVRIRKSEVTNACGSV